MDINGPRRTGHHPQLRYTSSLPPTKWEQSEPIPTKKKKKLKKEKLEMASGEVGKDLKNDDYWPMVNINSSDAYKRQPWMCEVCEQQPAVFTCKADAAVLCLSCDSEVHSTNTLASRHQRVPITKSIFACSTTTNHNSGNSNSTNFLFKWSDDDESEERVEGFPLWQPPAQSNKLKEGPMVTMTDVVEHNDLSSTNLFSDVEKFLDLDYAPSPSTFLGFQHSNQHQHQNQQSRLFPVNNNVVSKSHGMIVVPEENKAKEEIHETETAAMVPVVAVGVDREARVMRYREKRKNRKFEKTIRYASRKAYAESRPRVKGRFIKREDNNDDDDATVMVVGGGNVYSSSSSSPRSISSAGNMLALNSGYGMVPSF